MCNFWFVRRPLSMSLLLHLLATVGYWHQTHAQACSWTWLEPPGGGSVTKSVGAPATFKAFVNDILTAGDFVTWKSGLTDLSIEEFSKVLSSFISLVNPRSFRTSIEDNPFNDTYTLTFPAGGVTLADDGGSITVTSQGCTTEGTSPAVSLSVRYCNLTAFTGGIPTDTLDCGYNCTKQFICDDSSESPISFWAACLENATWNVPEDRCISYITDALPAGLWEASLGLVGISLFCCICEVALYYRYQSKRTATKMKIMSKAEATNDSPTTTKAIDVTEIVGIAAILIIVTICLLLIAIAELTVAATIACASVAIVATVALSVFLCHRIKPPAKIDNPSAAAIRQFNPISDSVEEGNPNEKSEKLDDVVDVPTAQM